MKLKLTTTVKYNGKIHKAGEVIDIPQEKAEEMQAYGELVEYLTVSPSPDAPQDDQKVPDAQDDPKNTEDDQKVPDAPQDAPEQPNKAVNGESDTNTNVGKEKAVKKANTKSTRTSKGTSKKSSGKSVSEKADA